MTNILNHFPEFGVAARAVEGLDMELLAIGRQFSALGVSELFGLAVLHRHYKLDDHEIVVQVSTAERSVIVACRANEVTGHHPIGWCALSDLSEITAFEYAVMETDEAYARALAALPSAFTALRNAGLADKLGIIFLPVLPSSEEPLYEQTSERARISIVTPWRGPNIGSGSFARSVIAFRCEGKEVRVDGNKHCQMCLYCQPSHCDPSEPLQAKPQEYVEFHIAGRLQRFPVAAFTPDVAPMLLCQLS